MSDVTVGPTARTRWRHDGAAVDRRPPNEGDAAAAPHVYLRGPADSVAKRVVDVALATILLAVTAPVMLAAMALVKLESRGPAIFTQRRVGYRCNDLSVFKIRTMVHGAETMEASLAAEGEKTFLKIADDPRTTRIGRWLRKSSIDELPQLWNVLRGDMSLVGPRPLLATEFEGLPKAGQWRRFTAKPGLSGLWQVKGRSNCSDARRMHLDLQYIDEWTPWMDLKILLATVPVVLSGEGAS